MDAAWAFLPAPICRNTISPYKIAYIHDNTCFLLAAPNTGNWRTIHYQEQKTVELREKYFRLGALFPPS
jgi:hypothetical protein